MAISLDGHYVDANNSSRGLSSPLDVTILLLLRALSDVVIVGGATARQERYAPKQPRSELAHLSPTPPRLCVISRDVNFDKSDPMFQQDISQPIFVTQSSDDPQWVDRIATLQDVADVVVLPEVTGSGIQAALAERGLKAIVSEGGPFLQNLLRADNVLDEMDITISPTIVGTSSGMSALGTTSGELELQALARGGDHIYARFAVRS